MIGEDNTQKRGGYQGEIKRILYPLNSGGMAPSQFPLHHNGEPSIKHGESVLRGRQVGLAGTSGSDESFRAEGYGVVNLHLLALVLALECCSFIVKGIGIGHRR